MTVRDLTRTPARRSSPPRMPRSENCKLTNFTTPFKVRSYELDGLGHLNHAVFLNWFEQARFDALESRGWSPAALAERGWSVHVVRIEVDYRAECRLGERLTALTTVERLRNSSMILHQELRKADGEPAAEARVIAVWIGREGRPIRIPDEIRQALQEPDPE